MRPTSAPTTSLPAQRPALLARSVALMKPVTWFAPAWAFLCGSIASGASQWSVVDVGRIALGTLMAGPILCGLSQVMNDYYDRDVDAINEPQRLIPSGMVSMRQVFTTMGVLAAVGLAFAAFLGSGVMLLVLVGIALSAAYSADPLRAKRNGWVGNALVGISYEGLPWLAGHLSFAAINVPSLIMAVLFSVGTYGIMTINDFKSVEGDRQVGIRSIPVQIGASGASWMAILTINIAQLFVIGAFVVWGRWIPAGVIGALFLAQIPTQWRFLHMEDPRARAVFYNTSGVMLFVWGMLAAAIGVR